MKNFALRLCIVSIQVITFLALSTGDASPSELTVSEILANPAAHDQKTVTVKGRAMIVRKKMSAKKEPWNLISFFDMKDDKKVINVFGPGHAAIGNGDIVRVTGIFKAKSKRGRYTFNNEIQSSSDKIVLIQKAKH